MIASFDFETDPFGPCNLAPEPVCVSLSAEDGTGIVVASCEDGFDDLLESILKEDLVTLANGAFDMAVIVARRPKLAPLVFKAYREDRVADIQLREQLLVLADTGDLSFRTTRDGIRMPLKFSQADLEKKYLGIDRSEDKDSPDGWRKNFSILRGIPASDYPKEAYDYSLQDAVYCRQIHLLQEKNELSRAMKAQFLHSRASFALYLGSAWGFEVDTAEVERLFRDLSEKFHERNFPLLLQSGILKPSEPMRPYSRSLKKAVDAVGGVVPDSWEPHAEKLKALGIKMVDPVPGSITQEALRARVKAVSELHDIPLVLTETEKVSFAEEVLVELKGLDPVIDEYAARTETQKLVTTELPRMRFGRVHPRYRTIVKTSRTSSYGNRKDDKNPAYPSVNIQQIDPRVRHAYVASPGRVLCSIDYNYIELVSAAQKCLDLFGKSVLADKINAGYDPHAYLGSALARRFAPTEWAWSQDPDESYRSFLETKKTSNHFYKHWRGLAKPTGLGLSGGLGAKRFVGYAKSTFGVDLVAIAGSLEGAFEMAKEVRSEWFDTYPEFRAYFQWVTNECVDVEWTAPDDQRYCYVSPNGTWRRNCLFTDCANGAALQTPTAEGAKIALYSLAEAMYDPSQGSILLGTNMSAFIHDEVILEMDLDDYTHDRAMEAARIMREGMSQVMTKVKVDAEPALMHRWNKKAEPVYDKNNRLTVWQPT